MGPFELVSGLKLYRNIQHGKNYPSVYTVMLDCIDVQPQDSSVAKRKQHASVMRCSRRSYRWRPACAVFARRGVASSIFIVLPPAKLPVSRGEGVYIDPCNCLVYFRAALWLPVCDFSAVDQRMTYMVRWAPTGLSDCLTESHAPWEIQCNCGSSGTGVPTISMQFAGCFSGESFLQWCMGVPWCVAKPTTATFKLRPWRLNQTQPNRRKRAPAVACGFVAAENAAIIDATA